MMEVPPKVALLSRVIAKTAVDYEINLQEIMAAVTGVMMCVSEDMKITPTDLRYVLNQLCDQYETLITSKEVNEKN